MSEHPTVTLEPIGVADAGEVLTLQRAAFVTEAQLYGDPGLPPLTETLAALEADLRAGRGFVARAGHRIVGAVRTATRDGRLHIGRLVVAPDVQGRGIGASLLRAAEAAASVPEAVLFTGSRSVANLRFYFYERHGYRETHRAPLGDEVELVHLAKPLR